MLASCRTCLASLLLSLAIAHSVAEEPETPKADGDEVPKNAGRLINPVANPDDPLSTKMSEAEIARVEEIADEVRGLWKKSPRTALPADLQAPCSTERNGGYNAWIRPPYAEAWRVHGHSAGLHNEHPARGSVRAAAGRSV